MKIVKESINEIKRYEISRGGSGWGALGVGHAALYKAYNDIIRMNPSIKEKLLTLDNENWVMSDGLSGFKRKMEELLESPINKIACIYSHDLPGELSMYIFDEYIENRETIEEKRDLYWAGSGRSTEMTILTNKKSGIVYAKYVHDTVTRRIYCFRIP